MDANQHKHKESRSCQNNFLLCEITTLVSKWNCVDTRYLGFSKTYHVLQTCIYDMCIVIYIILVQNTAIQN